jgi:hypothetical protein
VEEPKSQPSPQPAEVKIEKIESSIRQTYFQRCRFWLGTNWQAIISTCALFLSALALKVSVDSGAATREHNRLSVRPHINLSFNANDKGAGWVRTISGAGPAIINAFTVTVDGKLVHTWDAVLDTFGIDPKRVIGTQKILRPGIYHLPGVEATSPLLWVESPPTARAALVKNSDRVQIKLVYCSLYDECWEQSLSSDQLEPKSVSKRKPELKFGVSQAWRDSFSQDQ